MSNVVIQAEGLTKKYRLGVINHGTLQKDIQSWWARLRGIEDPNTLLGEKQNSGKWFNALDDVSFDINQGEAVGIIGSNGAGKSTLLKILSRITAPTQGEVRLQGRVASLLEVGTGFHPELTGRENIFLNGAILGLKTEEIRRKFDEIVAFSEVERFIDTPVKRYSSGMYVRLAFAVAAHLEPEILIIDEVLAVGDVRFQKKCLGKMSEVRKEGRTVLFVSHNVSAVRQLCNRAILLDDGRVVSTGHTAEVVNNYLSRSTSVTSMSSLEIAEKLNGLPEDPHVNLVGFVFNQIDSQERSWIAGRPLSVSLEFQVKKPAPNLRVFFDVLDEYENLIFRSFHDGDFDAQETLEKGFYAARAVIPADLLAPMRYTLRVGATIFGSHSCTGEHLSVPFTLHHGGRVNRAYPHEVYLGQIAPLIDWRTERV